ncbi:protein still life, isoform SIF type 1 [Ischnura elegans]|uniref:protein still life, isoform SIF type 1 n=1 Tax=Ischnura elegans TaxID=197161 RepID=UPI001ED8815E|nr:protein still life, isoform SIF type 1 [Ischnura elegans]
MTLDSNTLKRMLKPMPSLASSIGGESPATSPETGRRRGGGPCLHPSHHHPMHTQQQHHQPHHQQHLHPQHMHHMQQQQQQMSMHHGYGMHPHHMQQQQQHPHQGHPMQHHMSQQQHHLGHHSHHHHHHGHHHSREDEDEMDDGNDMNASYLSEPEAGGGRRSRFSASRSAHEIGRSANGGGGYGRGLYLELERGGGQGGVVGGGGGGGSASPPSDNVLFDHACYATTPSSSNGNNSDLEMAPSNAASGTGVPTPTPTPGSPTSRLLLEYELHLRNTLAKGMDAESYSLHTFEALLTQSMENLEFAENLPGSAPRSPHPTRRRPASSASMNKSSTLPLPHRLPQQSSTSSVGDRPSSARDRDGYYSDRNELMRERERDRAASGYLSDHNSRFHRRERGGSPMRCASCHGSEFVGSSSSLATRSHFQQSNGGWSRHSDGWRGDRSSSAATGASTMSVASAGRGRGEGRSSHRSPWDSLPSLRHEGGDGSHYRADSFDRRSTGMFERQDSIRSEYGADGGPSGREGGRYGIVQQASIESADSRLCYLTSSEMSDDDRMSLTTAVSDEEEGDSAHNSPYRGAAAGTASASFNCTGAVRKAGFLSVKKWLLRKKHQIELARKRGWKGYWVCLKGTTLLFYPCESRDEGRSVEAAPKHLIIVDGAIMQPIPEHPKRDYIFCLSTAFGDAYLFQAPCQVELENWVNSIHSACAAAFARHRGKTGTLHLLQEEIFRLEKAIESDQKLKHMAELQQSVVSDPETKAQIGSQVVQWEENLERLHCEQFRLRCYMASLQNGELPNPKSLLTHVSRATKGTLNRLGVFTVSSFHAFICARSPSLLNNLLAGRGATKRRAPALAALSRSNSASGSGGTSGRRSLQHVGGAGSGSSTNVRDENDKNVRVSLPDGQSAVVFLREALSVEEFLTAACGRRGLSPTEHFVRVKKRRDMEDTNYFVPHRTDLIETYLHTHEVVEVCAKILYQVELQRTTLEHMWGFSVEAELMENADRQDELCCYVSRVEDKSVAMHNGIIKGDEIMVINGAIVSDLDMMYLESVLQEELALCMMMRSSRTEPPDPAGLMRGATDDIIDSLVCPPPPTDGLIPEEVLSGLIVPAPGWKTETSPAPSGTDTAKASRANSFEIENLLKTAEQVTGFCRSPAETRKSSPTGSVASGVGVGGSSGGLTHQLSTSSQNQQPLSSSNSNVNVNGSSSALLTPSRQLTDAEKLRKVILELVDTERTYVKHLNSLLENYLEPLKKETFLSNAEVTALFGNIQEIVAFQRLFLQNLDEALQLEPEFNHFEHPGQFKNVLFSIGSAFLYYVNHFKLYSSFCASHSKAQKVLHPNEGNQALQEFLQARNPRQQHSSTLESYLIKPIQRILKYPLLLQQLRNLTDPRSDEHTHLVEALKGMEKVAEHINEMQRIHEEYGAIFDHLFRQHQKSCKQPIDLSPGDLLYYGGVEWLNISDFLGKIKKGLELHAMCFVFKSAVVFLCKERLRQKKKLMGVSSKASSSEVEIIRYQVLIPVTEVQVRASSAKDVVDSSHYLWELIHLRSQLQRRSEKVYVLSNSTPDFRNAFLKTIRQIIRESVRNMSIPATKPASSMGGSSVASATSSNTATLGRPGTGGAAIGSSTTGVAPGAAAAAAAAQGSSHTLGKPSRKPPKGPQRHSAGNIDYDNLTGSGAQSEGERTGGRASGGSTSSAASGVTAVSSREDGDGGSSNNNVNSGSGSAFRARSKTVSDVIVTEPSGSSQGSGSKGDGGAKSEGEEETVSGAKTAPPTPTPQSTGAEITTTSKSSTNLSAPTSGRKAGTLGRTPNHLSLSTTSTLSAGSSSGGGGHQARLIQSSHQPENYTPQPVKDLGSPVWKPRDLVGEATTLPRKGKSSTSDAAGGSSSGVSTTSGRFLVYDDYSSTSLYPGAPSSSTSSSPAQTSSTGKRDEIPSSSQ